MSLADTANPIQPRLGLLSRILDSVNPDELITSREHSRDFDHARADFVFRRVRLLSLALALAALLWIPVDFAFLDPALARQMLILRLGFSGGFLFIGLWRREPHSLRLMRVRMGLLVLIPALFYVGSRMAVGGGLPVDGFLVGYSFLPFLIAALLGIFPLTFKEGGGYAAILLVAVSGTDAAYGTLFTVSGMRDAWLLGLLFVVAFWGQLSQLDMLLRLHREATRDALTGLVNRRVLIRRLDREIQHAQETGEPLSLVLFDLDLFKRINDTHGHLTGDRVLKAFAEVLNEHLPQRALAGRYGGEEFTAVLPGMGKRAAFGVAEDIRRTWRESNLSGPAGEPLVLSVSSGVAQLRPSDTPEGLVSRVDDSLYQAKESGRDLVVQVG